MVESCGDESVSVCVKKRFNLHATEMSDYIQVTTNSENASKWLPVGTDGIIFLEVLQSAFPRDSGMCFEVDNRCFVVKLHRGSFYPPVNAWQQHCYFPVFDDDDDKYDH